MISSWIIPLFGYQIKWNEIRIIYLLLNNLAISIMKGEDISDI